MNNAFIKPETPKTIAEMQSLGEVFVKSRFFQDSQDAAQAIVKVMAGAELGFPPIASMTGVYIVKGKVSLSANLIAAAIKRSGRYTYRVRKLDDSGCEIAFYEGGTEIGSSSFTREDAQQAQLLGKETWRSFFRNMAFARALSNGAKWHCPDVFGGPVYTPEELGAETDGEGEMINVTPEPETKKPLALVPPIQAEGEPLRLRPEQVEQLESAPIADPLPETQNTTRDNEAHADLDREIKQCILDAGGNNESWEKYRVEKKLDEQTLGWKQSLIERMREKLKARPKSEKPEQASGYAGQRQDGARKVLRKSESGELKAQWEEPVADEPEKKSKLKAVVDEVIAEHWPNTPDGYNEGYKATRAKMESLIGPFKNFEDINAADQAKLIAALGRWNPADDKPKGKGKK